MVDFKTTQTGNQASILLGEKLVASDVSELKTEMKRLIADGVTSMVLDCSRLNLIDSSGIGCLVAAHNSLTNLNGKLSVTQVSSDIYELLCSMRLDHHFTISPSSSPNE